MGEFSSGKSLTARNIFLRADPPFERLIVCHIDAKTKEWNDCNAHILDYIPDPDSWGNGEQKTLCIIDDINFRGMSKQQKSNLNRLFGYTSSHCNVSVILTTQNFYEVPISVRRMANFFVVWKSRDLRNMRSMASRMGFSTEEFMKLVNDHLTAYHDSLWVDYTPHSPFFIRKNGYKMIE